MSPTSYQAAPPRDNCVSLDLVPGAGIEPARLAAGDFESHTKMSVGVRFGHIFGAKNANLSRIWEMFCAND